MTKPLTIWVDDDISEATLMAAFGGHEVEGVIGHGDTSVPDLILSTKARYFEPEWFSDPKLVEAALKRARAEKRKKVKK